MTQAEALSSHTRPGDLVIPLEGRRLRCVACGHRCPIPAGFSGVCKLRFNRLGELRVPYGYVNVLRLEAIEKKPFFHALPGGTALSFGMLGCSFHCGYCQNWISSQTLRDLRSDLEFRETTPEEIVGAALTRNAGAVVSTYNEPLVSIEWAADVFRAAHAAGLATGFVSNGNATPEALRYLRPHLDLFKVDLKSMSDAQYRQFGGRLQPVLDSIAAIHEMGFWLEVVTLVVPGFNDSEAELRELAGFLAGVSPEIPWHATAFHPAYRMMDAPATPSSSIRRALLIGREAGLRYVYPGNLEGVGDMENTRCAGCNTLLIERHGMRVLRNRLPADGACPNCGSRIPGFWRAGMPKRDAFETIHERCG